MAPFSGAGETGVVSPNTKLIIPKSQLRSQLIPVTFEVSVDLEG